MSRAFSSLGGFVVALILAGIAHGQDSDAHPHHTDSSAPSQVVGQMVRLGDFGSDDLAYLVVPNTPPTVGIVLVPDAYGLDDFTKSEAVRLGGEGYLALAIDIYNGHRTADPGEMANFAANLNAETVMKTVDSGIRFFRESPRFRADHVVLMGWGTGATYVFQAAKESKILDGAITFYGPIELKQDRIGKFSTPLCAVYPDNDPEITHDNVVTFQRLMKEAGNDFEAWFISAGRGWSNPQSKAYNHPEDKEAWKVATPFLMRIGATSAKKAKGKDDSIIDKAGNSLKNIFN